MALIYSKVGTDDAITDAVEALTPAAIGAAALVHTHAIADVTGLQAALDAKADDATTLAGYGITDALTAAQIAATYATQAALDALTAGDVGAEPALGNPGANGYVLASQTDGTRSWVEMAAGGGVALDEANTWTAPQTVAPSAVGLPFAIEAEGTEEPDYISSTKVLELRNQGSTFRFRHKYRAGEYSGWSMDVIPPFGTPLTGALEIANAFGGKRIDTALSLGFSTAGVTLIQEANVLRYSDGAPGMKWRWSHGSANYPSMEFSWADGFRVRGLYDSELIFQATQDAATLLGIGQTRGAADAVHDGARLRRRYDGTPSAGFGWRTVTELKSSTTNDRAAAYDDTLWTDATDASRTAERRLMLALSGTLTEAQRVDFGSGAGTTGLMLWDSGAATLRRVEIGAADSAGSGYRQLRIVN